MADNYVYAVARIRSLEISLFSNAVIDQLIACKSYENCIQFLQRSEERRVGKECG